MKKAIVFISLLVIIASSFGAFPTNDGFVNGKLTLVGTHAFGGYTWVYFKIDSYPNDFFARQLDGTEYAKSQYAQILAAYNSSENVMIWAAAATNLQPAGHFYAHSFTSFEIHK